MIIGKSLTALGGGGLKPEIRVTAKAGALLNLRYKDSSIILQSYQLGAKETQHTFVVDVSETAYVVEDVTNSASVEVFVDAVAVFEVEIEYVLWLYRDDDECEAVTGGWNRIASGYSHGNMIYAQNGSYNTFSKQSDHMELRSYYIYGVLIRPVNKFDFSKYSKLCVYTKAIQNTDSSPLVYITNETVLAGTSTDTRFYFDPQNQPKDEYGLVSIDLNIAENRYLLFEVYSGRGCDIQKVWLE